MSGVALGSDYTCDACGSVEHSTSLNMPSGWSRLSLGVPCYGPEHFEVCRDCWPKPVPLTSRAKRVSTFAKLFDLFKKNEANG